MHRTLHVVTVLIEQGDGSMQRQTREFGGFRRDCRALSRKCCRMLGRTTCCRPIPGIDEIAAALILIEIGDDMGRFVCAERLAS